jgi:hypothetical protein
MKNVRRHHGLALLIVLALVGVASLIGMAMLANASLQSQVAASTVKGATAEFMAESGVQTATYYVQRNFAAMPSGWDSHSGYALYAKNVTIPGVSGTFDVTAAATSTPDEFQISATGRDGTASSSAVTRSSAAKVQVIRAIPTYAAGIGGNVTVNNNVFFNGPVVAQGTISGLGAVLISLLRTVFSVTELVVPATGTGTINYYGGTATVGTYTLPDGSVNVPQLVPSTSIASPAVLVPNANNKGNVFYSMGDLTITGGGTYNATFIVHGKLIVTANSASITINRKPGLPALIADSSMFVNAKNTTVNVNGVAWLGGGFGWGNVLTAIGSRVNINGSLLMPGGQTLGGLNASTLTINYTPANVDVINVTTNSPSAVAVKLNNWK